MNAAGNNSVEKDRTVSYKELERTVKGSKKEKEWNLRLDTHGIKKASCRKHENNVIITSNNSWKLGKVPERHYTAAIINIYRTGPRNATDNYRNVSPLSVTSNLHADVLKTD